MACPNRFPGALRAPSALRRLPDAYAARRPGDVYDARRHRNGSRDANRGASACCTARPVFDADDADDASARESES